MEFLCASLYHKFCFVCFTFFVCMYACNNSSTDVHIFLSNHPTIFDFICKRILRLNPFFYY